MKLRVLTGPRRDEEITLEPGGSVLIGRDASCGFRLDDRKLSRKHCSVSWKNGAWALCDGGSANGTWVDGQRVEERILAHGDTITLGDTAFEFVDERGGVDALSVDASGAPVYEEATESSEHAEPPPPSSRERRTQRSSSVSLIRSAIGFLAVAGLLVFLVSRTDTGDPDEKSGKSTAVAKKTKPSKTSSRATSKTIARPAKAVTKDKPDEQRGPEEEEPPKLSGGERRLRVLVDETLPKYVEQRLFNRALSLIDYHVRMAADFDAKSEREKVHVAARLLLAKTVAEMDRLGGENKGDEALELAFGRLRFLPPQEADDLTVAINQFTTKEQRLEIEDLGRDKFELDSSMRVLRAIGAFDFPAAREVVANARAADGAVALKPEVVDKLAHRVEVAELAWSGLSRSLDAKAAAGDSVLLEFHEGRPLVELRQSGGMFVATEVSRGRYTLLSVAGGFVDAERAKEGRLLFDVLALSDDCLLRMIRGRKKPDPVVAASQLEGLGLLLLLREGPSRVDSFLDAQKVDDSARGEIAKLVGEHRDTWLLERRKRTRIARNYIGTDVEATHDDWIRLGGRIAEIALLWKGRVDYRSHSRDLLNSYRDARLEHLRRQPPSRAFHASKLEVDGDMLKLVYDFATDTQLEDLLPVATSSSVGRKGKNLMLRGECRFFKGNPFAGKLSVKVRLPAGGYSPARPSVGIALWTFEGYSVRGTSSMALTLSMKPEKAPYADYFVFAYGYHAAPYDFGGEKIYQVHPVTDEEFMDLPADVIFLGRHGRSLHQFSGECLWAQRRKKRTVGALTIQVEAGEGVGSWSANKTAIIRKAPAPLLGYLEARERVGSVSLLTNVNSVLIRSVEIEGRLDPIWIQDRFQTAIEKELVRIFE